MRTLIKCPECNGCGDLDVDVCISEWEPPARHEQVDDLKKIVGDAVKAKADHQRLCEMNPRAKESYDRQLGETLAKLEAEAKSILKNHATA